MAECLPALKAEFQITDEEAQELLPSGRMTTFASRVHWARTYLSKAGLLTSPKRNYHVITEKGRQVLATAPDRIDIQMLEDSAEFREWRQASVAGAAPAEGHVPPLPARGALTPEDAMEAAQATLDAALRDDLLTLLFEISPERFEKLIVDLLAAMGFGGGNPSGGLTTRRTRDGGVDGIMHEDTLGLDAVYI